MHDLLKDLVPISFIVFVFGGGIIKRFLDIQEQRIQAKIATQDQNLVEQITALRQEIAQLRDTSTQYDMSIEHRLADMERRLSSQELGSRSKTSSIPVEEEAASLINTPRA